MKVPGVLDIFTWIPLMVAASIPCNLPTLPHAEVTTSDYDYGDEATRTSHKAIPSGDYVSINCHFGYTSGSIKTIFQCLNGTWQPELPVCKKASIPCNLPTLPHAEVTTSDYDYGDEATRTSHKAIPSGDYVSINCHFGYTSGSIKTIFQCLNGTWQPELPVCKKVPTVRKPTTTVCQLPSLLHGTILLGGEPAPKLVPVASKVHITCQSGFRLEGASDNTCGRNIKWYKPFPRCVSIEESSKECLLPNISNSRINVIGSAHDELDIGCEPGYQRVGQRFLKCSENGSWSEQPPSCRVLIFQFGQCLIPAVANAKYLNISLEDRDDIQKNGFDKEKYENQNVISQDNAQRVEISVGAIVAIQCQANYKLIGQPVVECNELKPVASYAWPRCQSIENKGPNLAIIIGCSVAGAIIVVLAVIVGIILYRKRHGSSTSKHNSSHEVKDSFLNGAVAHV